MDVRPSVRASRGDAEARNRGRGEWRRRLREAVDSIKATTPCADCGLFFPAICMDFDHVRGEKRFGISVAVGKGTYSLETLLAELDKCELVCANCHRLRTWRSDRPLPDNSPKPIAGRLH